MPESNKDLYQQKLKRIKDAVHLKKQDRVPIILKFGYFVARYTGITYQDLIYDLLKCSAACRKNTTSRRGYNMLGFSRRLLVLALALMTPANAAEMTPDRWPEGRREQAERRDAFIFPTQARTVRGRRELISAVGSPIALEAGMQALREGGTAADAAIATALMQVTAFAGANVSFAGVVQLVYFDAATGKVYVLDAGWKGWKGERHPETIAVPDRKLLTGQARAPGSAPTAADGRKTLVPGFMLGLETAQRRFGKLPFHDLLAPAIWYAERGVPITPLLRTYFGMAEADLGKTQEGRAFLEAGKAGNLFVAPGLAETLKSVAKGGAKVMYRGAWARHYVAAVKAAGGAATMADMAAYGVRWSEPLSTSFNGTRVFAPGGDNEAGCRILEALNLIEHSPARGNYWEDAEAFRALTLSVRVAQMSHYLPAAAAFEKSAGVGGSCAARAEPAYGAAATPVLEQLLGGAAPATPLPGEHTASVVAVDHWGNVAVLVHSANSSLWGDTGLVVDGVPIPASAPTFRHLLVGQAPGSRVPSSMAPVIALMNGKPVLAIAHVGVSSVQETVRVMAALRSAPPEKVIPEPPLLLNIEQTTDPLLSRAEPVPAGAYPPELLSKLKLSVRELPLQQVSSLRGTVAFAILDGQHLESVEVPGILNFVDAN